MSEQTPDAISAAFREMEQADPEPLTIVAFTRTAYSVCNECTRRTKQVIIREDYGPIDHAPDCPWLRRKQKRDALKKAWEEREGTISSVVNRLDGILGEEWVHEPWNVGALAILQTIHDALAALKGAHTK